MKSVKWMYVSAMAIAFGMLSFATVACHDDDDDPKPAEGEVIETPKPVVEYYIKGAVTVKGEGKSGVKVKVGDKDCITDSKGEFSVTESNTGTYEVSVAPNGYLSQKTSVKIADINFTVFHKGRILLRIFFNYTCRDHNFHFRKRHIFNNFVRLNLSKVFCGCRNRLI